MGDFLDCFGDVVLFVFEFSSIEFSWSSEFPSSDDDFFGSLIILDVESFLKALMRSTDRDFLNADFIADERHFLLDDSVA